jgi:hypothetical protein
MRLIKPWHILTVRLSRRLYDRWIAVRSGARGIEYAYSDYPIPTQLQIHQMIIIRDLSRCDIDMWIRSDKRLAKPCNRQVFVYLRLVRDSIIEYELW